MKQKQSGGLTTARIWRFCALMTAKLDRYNFLSTMLSSRIRILPRFRIQRLSMLRVIKYRFISQVNETLPKVKVMSYSIGSSSAPVEYTIPSEIIRLG